MKQRLIGALLIGLIAIPLIIIGGLPFSCGVALIAVLAIRELIMCRDEKKQIPKSLKLFAYIITAFLVFNNYNEGYAVFNLDTRVLSVLMFAFFLPIVTTNDNNRYNLNDALYLMGSTLFIGLSFNLMCLIRNASLEYIVFLLLITIFTDTYALITGAFVGRHKLAEKISPKKTVEGLIGGTLVGTIIPCLYYLEVINPTVNLLHLVIVVVTLSLIGQIGDLAFSQVKRFYGKKDFSNLIPGHGGILDRLDSIIFVLLAFIMFISII